MAFSCRHLRAALSFTAVPLSSIERNSRKNSKAVADIAIPKTCVSICPNECSCSHEVFDTALIVAHAESVLSISLKSAACLTFAAAAMPLSLMPKDTKNRIAVAAVAAVAGRLIRLLHCAHRISKTCQAQVGVCSQYGSPWQRCRLELCH